MTVPNHSPEGPGYSIRAVQRVCDILTFLQASPRDVSLMEVASAAKLPKRSASRYLVTLERRGFVESDPGACRYRAGSALQGPQAHERELLTRRARPHLQRLCDQSQETISLGVLDRGEVCYLAIIESPRTLRVTPHPSDRAPIHATAIGKAIAAGLPDDQLHTILAATGSPGLTAHTITYPDAFLTELVAVRAQGYALEDREHEADSRGVAVPVRGSVAAAIGLSAPASRLPLVRAEETVAALAHVISALEGETRDPAA
jgi:IclR family acetate operon transcriptional repressor